MYFNELAITAEDVTPDQTPFEKALLGFINHAATSIGVTLYSLDRQRVIDALITVRDRGVAGRVVGDDEATTGEYSSSYEALTNAKIAIATDTNISKFQLDKFLAPRVVRHTKSRSRPELGLYKLAVCAQAAARELRN